MTTATHVDAQVIAATRTLLSGISGPDGSILRVYQSRVYPQVAQQAPCLAIYMPTVGAQQETRGAPGSRLQRRSDIVRVAVVVAGTAGPDNTLENDLLAICLQVENALAAGFALGAPGGPRPVLKFVFTGRETVPTTLGTRTVLAGVNSYVATVDHREGAAETALTQIS